MTITQAEADQLLAQDLERFEKTIIELINPALTQTQFDALVSWSFNVGSGAVQESTLRRRLNAGEDVNTVISEELPRWCNGPNGPLEGLVRRRTAEVKLAVQGQFP
jgi:GH24 family phage-related lysozyme (muramidase)